jgi:hypothetical protein
VLYATRLLELESYKESDQSDLLSLKEEAPFQNMYKSWKEKYDRGSQQDPKPRVTVLARASSMVTDGPTRILQCRN